MKTRKKLLNIFLPALLVVFMAGCDFLGKDDPESGTLTISLSNQVSSQALGLESDTYVSAAGLSYNVTLLEYIVSDIQITDEDGNVVSIADAHYVNQADASTYSMGMIEVPPAKYVSLNFTFGIDGEKNEFGTLERSADFDNMLWPMMMPMGDGVMERYHYMRFEGRFGTDGVFRIHTGPSGGNDYSIDVSLPLDMDVDGDDWNLDIVSSIDEWLTQPYDWNFADYGMIMGNQTAQNLVYENGHDVFKLGGVASN